MKKFLFSTMIASLLAFVGCQNEELVNENTPNGGEKVILTANIQGAADSRVALTPATDDEGKPIVKVAWREYDENDPETFFVDGENGVYKFTQVSDTEFSGTLPEPYSDGSYEALYNLDLWSNFGGNKYYTFEQDGTLREQDMMMMAFFNEGDTSIEFQHMMSILKPTFRVGEDTVNNTITHIEMGVIEACSTTVVIDVKPTAPATTLQNDIYLTIPTIEFPFTPSNFKPGTTFNFAVTADGKDYTGSLTIPQMDDWDPMGKLFTATIALTEKVEVNPAKNELRYVETEKTFYVSGPNGLLALNKWMTSTGDDSHNEFINIGFPITGTLSSSSRLGRNITLEADITLPLKTSDGTEITIGNNGVPSGSNWNPVGDNYNNYYKGVIDGGNHTITNIVVSSSTYYYSGFVGYLNTGGSVKNLKLDNVHISAGKSNCAAVIGHLNNTTVENCHVLSGSVNGNGTGYVGGIVGNTNSDFGIIGCTNNATIQGTGNYVGGIVGYLEDNNSSSSKARVICCANLGEVNSAGAYVGGIVGYKKEYGKVVGCWTIGTNEKDENGAETADTNKDGIGCLKGSLTRCYSAAKKGAEESAQKYINDKVSTMNSGLNSYGWQWISGTDSSIDWPTLRKN